MAVTVGVDGAISSATAVASPPAGAAATVNRRPVRLRPTILGRPRGRWVEPDLQRFVRQAFRQRPAQARAPRPPDAFPSGRRAHPEAGGNLAFGHAGGRQPQHVADLARRYNLGPGIAPLLWRKEQQIRAGFAGSPNGAYHPHPQDGRDRPEWVVAINRNAWSQSIGTAGRDHPVRALDCRIEIAA